MLLRSLRERAWRSRPTQGDRHQTVFLDAGHGGIDPGGVGTTSAGTAIDEAHLTLPVELDAMQLLRAEGFRVVVSRTTQSTVVRLGPGMESGGELTLAGIPRRRRGTRRLCQ